jgi:hypothetical protein
MIGHVASLGWARDAEGHGPGPGSEAQVSFSGHGSTEFRGWLRVE